MATLTIRQLDDTVYERLKVRARANKRSLEAEVRMLLEERSRDVVGIVGEMQAFQATMIERHGFISDTSALLRAGRDDN